MQTMANLNIVDDMPWKINYRQNKEKGKEEDLPNDSTIPTQCLESLQILSCVI